MVPSRSTLAGALTIGALFSSSPLDAFSSSSAAVGAPLIKTMFVNFCVPAMTHLAVHTRSWVTLALKIPHALTRNQRKKVCTSTTQDWNLAASYGELLLCMTICLAYSSGIPVLLWVATFGFTLKFWCVSPLVPVPVPVLLPLFLARLCC